MPTPKLGVFLPTMSQADGRPGDVVAAARHAEALGFESVWVVDQLIAGTGVPVLDSVTVLAAVAAATSRVQLGFGVMIVPLRPVAWIAKQVATLQFLSGDRVLLGVGVGGDRHDRSWDAVGVPRRARGRRTDDALRLLPELLAGRPVRVAGEADRDAGSTIQLSPPAPMPPLLVGGTSDAALRRTVDHAADWFLFPGPPASVREAGERAASAASARGRATPRLTASLMVALQPDDAVPTREVLAAELTDPDGMFGMPAEAVDVVLTRGRAEDLAVLLASLGDAGADRVVVTVAGGDWHRQAELVAEAAALAG